MIQIRWFHVITMLLELTIYYNPYFFYILNSMDLINKLINPNKLELGYIKRYSSVCACPFVLIKGVNVIN